MRDLPRRPRMRAQFDLGFPLQRRRCRTFMLTGRHPGELSERINLERLYQLSYPFVLALTHTLKERGIVSYKTLLGSVATIAGVSLAIIGLSVLHRRQLMEPAAVAAPSKGDTATPAASANSIHPSQYTGNMPLVPVGHCNIERLDGALFGTEVRQVSGAGFELSGWVVDQGKKSVPDGANIWLEKKDDSRIWSVPLALTINRPDVMENQGGAPAYLQSGFSVKINPSSLPGGEYHLLIQYPRDGHAYVCDNGRHLRVGP